MMKNKCEYKIIEKFLERVKPQTKADKELWLKLQRPAPTFGNTLLCVCALPKLAGLSKKWVSQTTII